VWEGHLRVWVLSGGRAGRKAFPVRWRADPAVVIRPLGSRGYPFRLDPVLAFVGRAPTFWAAFSERSAGFAESRPDTASSKARR
jgi:hypothetical protein